MTNLSININKIAWLRNARDGDIPNLVDMTLNIIAVSYTHLPSPRDLSTSRMPSSA